jgi:hypothetical protein
MKDSSDKPESRDQTEQNVRKEFLQLWGKLVSQSWEDESLRQRLLNEPAKVLTEHGAEFPAHVEVKLLHDVDTTIYLPFPEKPDSAELVDEELDQVAGGRKGLAAFRKSGITFRGRTIKEDASMTTSSMVVAVGVV